MDEAAQTVATKKRPRPVWFIYVATGVVLAAGLALVAGYARYRYYRTHADTILRDRLVASLSARFNSPVTVDSLHLDMSDGVHVTGTGLKILYLAGPTRPDADPTRPPPMVSVDSFEFQTDFFELLKPTTRILTVFVRGLQLDIPPHQPESPKRGARPAPRSQSRISLAVGKIVCTDSRLVVETAKPGKLPLVFDIQSITLLDVGADKPFGFDATLTNPKPIGDVRVQGHFGPWQAADPRDTVIDGNYWFLHADLSTFKGISGMLSSAGKFDGKLGHISIEGTSDIPDFKLDLSDHPVAMHTSFVAEVNGMNGDTTLRQVEAHVLHSVLHASGSIFRVGTPASGITGHDTELTVTMDKGRIEDMLTLAAKTNPPVLRGAMTMRQRLSLPPGKISVSKKLRLTGSFTIRGATFGNPNLQETVDKLSMRAQGHPQEANARDARLVESTMTGEFTQANAVCDVSNVQYSMPGAMAKMSGQYSLDGQKFEFRGTVRTDATASQMVTGWKSALLRPFDSLLKRDGAGLEVPITISGTKSAPKFGIDTKKLFQ